MVALVRGLIKSAWHPLPGWPSCTLDEFRWLTQGHALAAIAPQHSRHARSANSMTVAQMSVFVDAGCGVTVVVARGRRR